MQIFIQAVTVYLVHCFKSVTELQEKITSMEMRNKRLMEAFKKKSQAIREVMYRLTGYRVDACSDNQYKLISMYAESQADYLLFEVSNIVLCCHKALTLCIQ